MTELRTERLLLRPLRPGDAEAVAATIGNWNVARWLSRVPHPVSVEETRTRILTNQARWAFGIEFQGEIVGAVKSSDHLGYWLAEPHWRRGLMSEAARAVVTAWFDAGEGDVMPSGYFVGNAGSARILARLGFEDQAVEPIFNMAEGKELPHQHVVLTRERWEKVR